MCKKSKKQELDRSQDGREVSLDSRCQEKGRKSPKGYIIRVLVCLIALGGFVLLYFTWVTIPVYKHYYQAEHLLSNNADISVQASLLVYDNKGFSLYNALPRDYGTGVRGFYCQLYGFKTPFCKNDSLRTQSVSQPIYKDKSIADIIGSELYQKLCDYCSENKIDIDDYNRHGN